VHPAIASPFPIASMLLQNPGGSRRAGHFAGRLCQRYVAPIAWLTLPVSAARADAQTLDDGQLIDADEDGALRREAHRR
jgi:hypothetical protein